MFKLNTSYITCSFVVGKGEFEKFARVTMKVRLTGIQYSEKVVEYCEEIMKASGKYTRSEAKAIDQFLMVFKDQDFPPGSSVVFAICAKGSLTVSKPISVLTSNNIDGMNGLFTTCDADCIFERAESPENWKIGNQEQVVG